MASIEKAGEALGRYPFDFIAHPVVVPRDPSALDVPVLIVGGGIAGLCAALEMAVLGIRTLVLERDNTVCYGSRAICFSRRSLEIFSRLGVLGPILDKGLPWTGGRSFYRDAEVLHFTMPHDENQHLPPMINLQQYYVEDFLVRALAKYPHLATVMWGCELTALVEERDRVEANAVSSLGSFVIKADWVIAADGARSRLRELLGLRMEGSTYEGRYVVADIQTELDLPTERLAWFDPPSNPGSTILMHRQPDNIWRIDYQLGDGEDSAAAVLPENVLPRVAAHLEMIGQSGPWTPIWISLYKANALTLASYRQGRVLFAGDAAHLVPIFGVRGANSTIDDVDNLAWKLALVIRGLSSERLLETYSEERVAAAHENLGYGIKSTEFMAPPTFAYRWMRTAALGLARRHPRVRSLINPRQSSPIRYGESTLNMKDGFDRDTESGPPPGALIPSCAVELIETGVGRQVYVSDLVAAGRFVLFAFVADGAGAPAGLARVIDALGQIGVGCDAVAVARQPADDQRWQSIRDADGRMHALFGATTGDAYLIRPDGHVIARWHEAHEGMVVRHVCAVLSLQRKDGFGD